MDNLTHTLVGVLVGETIAATTSPVRNGLPVQQRRNLLVTLTAIGSNVPDLDFLSSAINGDKLAYLLEHRGHTHTGVGALVAAALLYLACEAWCRWRKWPLAGRDRLVIAASALLCLLLHIAMDFTNNYGVHPFWPFYNGWLYGDTIFIWEPLLWTAGAPLIFILRTKVARALVGALLVGAIAACFGSGLVPAGFSILMMMLTAVMMLVGRFAARPVALLSGIATWLAVTAVFAMSRSATEAQLRQLIAQRLPAATVFDYVLTPMPANPLCWDVMLPMTIEDRYVIRHGTWSLWPQLLPANHCSGRDLFKDISAPMAAVSENDAPAMLWHGEIAMSRDETRRLVADNCEVAAFMRFARVPWTLRREKDWVVGDLRYDREPGLGFAELELRDGESNCPSSVPPWIPPRSDLLQ